MNLLWVERNRHDPISLVGQDAWLATNQDHVILYPPAPSRATLLVVQPRRASCIETRAYRVHYHHCLRANRDTTYTMKHQCLHGRSLAIITGSSRGLGFRIAQELCSLEDPSTGHGRFCPAGHDLLLIASSQENLNRAMVELRSQTGFKADVRLYGHVVDLGDLEKLEGLLKQLGKGPDEVNYTLVLFMISISKRKLLCILSLMCLLAYMCPCLNASQQPLV